MRLLINTSKLRFGGAVQVAASFVEECRAHDEHEYHVVLGPGVGAVLDPTTFPDNFRFYRKAFGVMTLRKLPRVQREMADLETQVRPDCVLTTSGPPFWRSRAPHLVGFNRPLFIYPDSPYLKNLSAARSVKLAAQRWLHCRYFKRDSDALIAQTEDVNRRVRKLLRTEKVYTVTNTHNRWYDQPEEYPRRLPEPADGVYRFLTLTSYYPHKNLDLIPSVIGALRDVFRSRVEFILTLTEEQYRERIGAHIPSQVRLTGPIRPQEAPSLYRECDAMLLPTLAECFSASYPEAMKMKKPIITTDLGFSRSICKDAALYFQPCDPNSAAKQVERLVSNPGLQAELKELGEARLSRFHSAAERAERILEICQGMSQS